MAGKIDLLLGIGFSSAKEKAPATLPADFFSTRDASATTGVKEAQAAKEDSKGQAQAAARAEKAQSARDFGSVAEVVVDL